VLDEYIQAGDELIDDDLIAFDGRLFQVLSLPKQPRRKEMQPPTEDSSPACKVRAPQEKERLKKRKRQQPPASPITPEQKLPTPLPEYSNRRTVET
jgi:hypothetical protein